MFLFMDIVMNMPGFGLGVITCTSPPAPFRNPPTPMPDSPDHSDSERLPGSYVRDDDEENETDDAAGQGTSDREEDESGGSAQISLESLLLQLFQGQMQQTVYQQQQESTRRTRRSGRASKEEEEEPESRPMPKHRRTYSPPPSTNATSPTSELISKLADLTLLGHHDTVFQSKAVKKRSTTSHMTRVREMCADPRAVVTPAKRKVAIGQVRHMREEGGRMRGSTAMQVIVVP
ncbi:hypothetical protein HDU93_000652 [Gonapodya sp. JEL0774]|nr:hypothetical protein HDU93_000652 [Gonapodya sp. JEL0774]